MTLIVSVKEEGEEGVGLNSELSKECEGGRQWTRLM